MRALTAIRVSLPIMATGLLASPASAQYSGGVMNAADSAVAGPQSIGTASNNNVTADVMPQMETCIASDLTNPQTLVAGWVDYRFATDHSTVGFSVSFDGGANWSTGDTFRSYGTSYASYLAQSDPAVAAFRNGVFYFAMLDFKGKDLQPPFHERENRLIVGKTTLTGNGGVSWSVPPGVVVSYPVDDWFVDRGVST